MTPSLHHEHDDYDPPPPEVPSPDEYLESAYEERYAYDDDA